MTEYNDAFMRNRDSAVQARTKAQNRASVLQLKLIGQSHPTGLTNNLLKLFEPRPPLEYKPPLEKRKCLPYTGMAQFVSHFAESGEPEYSPPVVKGETKAQKKARIHTLRLEKGAEKAAEEIQKYDPQNDPTITGDPYKTLFVARLSYETTEQRIKREFETYGPIKRVRLITDKRSNKPRGYAFVEFVHTRDMKNAYKQADGRKLDSRRVLVDVERGRTVANWRPRRLGGGLGTTRVGGEEVNQKYSGREPQHIASGGPPRSEDSRARDDREREKSREGGRDRAREREQSREQSQDRIRDRDLREERHHNRDRDRNRDRDKERDRGPDRDRDRDRTRDRDRERDRGRDNERTRERDRHRERGRDRERDSDRSGREGRGRTHEREQIELKHERQQRDEIERDYDDGELGEENDWYDNPSNSVLGKDYDRSSGQQQNDRLEPHLLGDPEHDQKHFKQNGPGDGYQSYDPMERDVYDSQLDHADPGPRDKERARYELQQHERSLSPEYEN